LVSKHRDRPINPAGRSTGSSSRIESITLSLGCRKLTAAEAEVGPSPCWQGWSSLQNKSFGFEKIDT
jgi:hypothetical protein